MGLPAPSGGGEFAEKERNLPDPFSSTDRDLHGSQLHTQTVRATGCGACGVDLSDEMAMTTRRLLASLDEGRRAKLVETYQGSEPPEVLCGECFLPTVATLNGVTNG